MNRNGFTLISVLIASAITGIVAVIVMTIIDNTTRVMVRGSVQDNFDGLVRTATAVLANRDLCSQALRGADDTELVEFIPGAPANITNIFIKPLGAGAPAPVSILSVNQQVYGGFRIGSIQFNEIQAGVGQGNTRTPGGMRKTYKGEVIIRMADPPAGHSALHGGSLVRRIPLTAVVSDDDKIEGCLLQPGEVQSLCDSMGGTYDTNTKTCTNINSDGAIDCQTECTTPPFTNCPERLTTCMAPPDVDNYYCFRIFLMKGINTTATPGRAIPICECRSVCYFGTSEGTAIQSNGTAATVSPGPYNAVN
jgi:hypothetical protein